MSGRIVMMCSILVLIRRQYNISMLSLRARLSMSWRLMSTKIGGVVIVNVKMILLIFIVFPICIVYLCVL